MVVCRWEQGVFPQLSPLRPSGQALSLVLTLSPLSTIIPGVSNAGRGACLDLLPAWSADDLDRCLAELRQHGAIMDLPARVIFQPWALDDAAPESPNVVRAWKKRWDALPTCDVKKAIDEHVRRFLLDYHTSADRPAKTKGDDNKPVDRWAWIRAWDSTFTEASLEAAANLSATFPKGVAEPSAMSPESLAPPFTESGNRKQGSGSRDQDQGTGIKIKKISGAAKRAATLRNATPAVLTFPCLGRCPTWTLSEQQVQEWKELYHGLDVEDECRRALAWIKANRPKTARGMPAFLVNWLNRSANIGRATRA
jgi:hypothetical protein